jgi:four helix bundle protein
MRDHTRLRAFKLADDLALSVYKVTQTFPDDERFGLVPQLRRSVVSIAANIVEGCARPSTADYARFIGMAYASAKELQYELSLSARLAYLSAEVHSQVGELATEVAKVLWALHVALTKRQHSGL